MADDVDKSSKTEPPTAKRLSEARSKGQFAKAPEIGMTLTLLAGFLIILAFAPQKAGDLAEFTRAVFENLHKINATQEGATHTLISAYQTLFFIVLPLLLACFVAGVIAEGLQTGFRLTPKAMEPNLNKMNPISGFKRIFGLKGLKAFAVDFLKFLAIGTVVWLTMLLVIDDPIFFTPVPIQYIPEFIHKLFVIMLALLILVIAIIAIIHYIIKKRENIQEMKMTKEEVKEERKSKEVAPEVKSTQRKKAMELLSSQNLDDVGTSDVVVTNPTHYAVALRYERGTNLAPIVVAKGENLLARRIKLIAAEYEVPTVEDKPLARALYALGKVGEPIPHEFYRIVAGILAHVYKMHSYYFHRLKARRLLAKPAA